MSSTNKRPLIDEAIADIEALAVAAAGLSSYISNEQEALTYQRQILDLISRIASKDVWGETA